MRCIYSKKYSKVILVLVIICLLILSILGYSILSNKIYYNPDNEEVFIYDDKIEDLEFSYLLDTYLEMEKPGLIFFEDRTEGEKNYKSKGFGCYEMYASANNYFTGENIYIEQIIKFLINKSKLTFEELKDEGLLSSQANEFVLPELENHIDESKNKKNLEKIKSISEFQNTDISISFKNRKSFEDIYNQIKKYDDIEFVWLAIDSIENGNINYPIGLSLIENIYGTTFTKEAMDKYPCIELDFNQDVSADTLRQSYNSKLKLLYDHPDFINLLSESSIPHYINSDTIAQLYDNSKNIDCYGVRLCGSPKDILSFILNEDTSYYYIHNVKNNFNS